MRTLKRMGSKGPQVSQSGRQASKDGGGPGVDGLHGVVALEAPQARTRDSESVVLPEGYHYLKALVVIDDPSLGIGIGLDNEFNITEIKPDGPGERAGIQLDDQLVEVNDYPVLGESPAAARCPAA